MRPDHEEFAGLLDEWAVAIVSDDPEAIGRFAEPDWLMVGEGGIFPREQFLAAVASGEVTHHSMSFEIEHVRLLGDVAVVIARGKNTGAYRGEAFHLDEWATDVFVRREGTWRCAHTHLTTVVEPKTH